MNKLRLNSDEKYVLDLIAKILNEEYEWQKRFDTLLGDPGKKGRRAMLPFDAFFLVNNLIVEYREKQHFQAISIMDTRMTISGVHRGEQRKIYDLRKEKWSADNNILLLVIAYSDLAHKNNGQLKREIDYDNAVLKNLINDSIKS